MATALITGGCGFLGSHLTERLLSEGHYVVAVDNFCTANAKNEPFLKSLPNASTHLIIIKENICDPWNWAKFEFRAPLSHVFHFASPASPPHYQRLGLETMWANSVGLSNAIHFADNHKARLIFSSTSEIYGDPEISPQTETYRGSVNTVGPRSCYDESKRFGEALIFTSNLKNKTNHGIVRIFNTYGPRMNPDDGRVVINFLLQGLEGKKLSVYGNGSQTRSFCYVNDLIQGILLFTQSKEMGPMNIGNEVEYSILELAKAIQKIFSEKSLAIEYTLLRVDDPKQRRPDITQARQKLGWEPQVPLEVGLGRMLDWLKTI